MRTMPADLIKTLAHPVWGGQIFQIKVPDISGDSKHYSQAQPKFQEQLG
jgi:hypothetical protein